MANCPSPEQQHLNITFGYNLAVLQFGENTEFHKPSQKTKKAQLLSLFAEIKKNKKSISRPFPHTTKSLAWHTPNILLN